MSSIRLQGKYVEDDNNVADIKMNKCINVITNYKYTANKTKKKTMRVKIVSVINRYIACNSQYTKNKLSVSRVWSQGVKLSLPELPVPPVFPLVVVAVALLVCGG